MKPSLKQFAGILGCTVEQCRALQRKNRAQLEAMREQVYRSGKRVNGYTAEQLTKLIEGQAR